MSDLKKLIVGDKVTVSGKQHSQYFNGETAVVDRALSEDGDLLLRFDQWSEGHGVGDHYWHFYESDAGEFTITKTGASVKEETIKVGDTVECVTDEWHWFTKGKRYEVVYLSTYANGVNMIDDEGDNAYLQCDEVRKVDPAPRFVTMWDYGHSFHPTGDKPFATEEEAEKHALAILNSGEHTSGTIAVFEVVGKHTVALTVTSEAA